jgi:hypothetical protein
MAGRLHRIQYISNLAPTLVRKDASMYLKPVAPTLVVLGHMMYPSFFQWCAENWKDVVYSPFAVQRIGSEEILRSAALLQPPLRHSYFLPQENVLFLMVSNEQRNTESYQYWTYRGASVVLLSKAPLSEETLRVYDPSPAAHIYANGVAASNSVIGRNTLSVSNPVFCAQGQRVPNWDPAAFLDVKTKNEQGCEVNPDLADAAAYMIERRPWTRISHNPYDPLK